MGYRCIDAFEYAGVIYPGGLLVEDGDAIVTSHRTNFTHVEESMSAVETATAAPGEFREAIAPGEFRKAARAQKSPAVKRSLAKQSHSHPESKEGE